MSPPRAKRQLAAVIADAAYWSLALAVVALILLSSQDPEDPSAAAAAMSDLDVETVPGGGGRGKLASRPCDEIYVVGEGETLHTISDKCGDPYIVEENPHIHDPDDVFPGLVIKITPSKPTRF